MNNPKISPPIFRRIDKERMPCYNEAKGGVAMQENRMFDEMMKAAKARLAGRCPQKIAKNANVDFIDGAFEFDTLGIRVRVAVPEFQILPQLDPWHQLLILHYLDLADGTALSGDAITFAQQKDGLVRGGGFDRTAEEAIRRQLGKLPLPVLQRRCQALGGVMKPSNADLCVEFSFFPMYPVTLKIWFADEEFEASGRLLLDGSASRYLTVEDSVILGELILMALAANE